MDVRNLKAMASKIRRDTFNSIINAQSGHIGGSFSIVEILTALYFDTMKLESERDKQDKLILSKGHGVPTQYAALAHKGLLDMKLLYSLREFGSPLQGHPDCKKVEALDMSSGSLGQGLSIGMGFALGQKLKGYESRTFVLLGDGELNEGQVWEAAMAAAHYKLGNLIAIVDCNGLQLDGTTESIMSLGDLEKKWSAFGWNVIETDGHDMEQLVSAFRSLPEDSELPTVIIAKTVKGKGVSFIENRVEYHSKLPAPELCKTAIDELEREVAKWEQQ